MPAYALRTKAQAQKAENNLLIRDSATYDRLQRYKAEGGLSSARAILEAASLLTEPRSNWPTFFLWSIDVNEMAAKANANSAGWWHDKNAISYPFERRLPDGRTRISHVPLLAGLLEMQKMGRGVTELDMIGVLPFYDPDVVSRILPVFRQEAAITLPGNGNYWIPSQQITEAYSRYSKDDRLMGQRLARLQVVESEAWEKMPPLTQLLVQFALRELGEVRNIDGRWTIFPVLDKPNLGRADKFHGHKAYRYIIYPNDEFRKEEGIDDDRVDIFTIVEDLFRKREKMVNDWVAPNLNSSLGKLRPTPIYDERHDELVISGVLGKAYRR